MDSIWSNHPGNPKRLKTSISDPADVRGNTLLHRFVLGFSPDPNPSRTEGYLRYTLRSLSDVPPNATNDDGYSALHLAVLKNDHFLVKKMLSWVTNIDVNVISSKGIGYTALHLATKLGNLSIIRELLNKGACIDTRTTHSETPLCIPVKSEYLEAIKLIKKDLYLAHFKVNLENPQFLVSSGAEVNFSDGRRNPLSYAAESGNLAIVEFLVNNGADISGDYRWCALCWAAWKGHLDVINFLMDRCENVDIEIKSGFDILIRAITTQHLATVEYVVSSGADVNAKNIYWLSPLHYAVKGSLEIVECLVNNHADVNAETAHGDTPLHYAVVRGNLEVVEFLVSKGANVNAKLQRGKTPLRYALNSRNLTIAKYLIEHCADLEAVDKNGRTPLHSAVYWEDLEIVKLLISRGVNLQPKDVYGSTPLHYAVCDGNSEIAVFLFKQYAGILPDFNGWTRENRSVFIKMLLPLVADIEPKNKRRETLLDVASKRKCRACIDALLER